MSEAVAQRTAAPPRPAQAATTSRRKRASKWDRPPGPMDWRWWVGGLGKILIAIGLLMFGFVAYQLWGTGIENARAQNALENEFEDLLASSPPPPSADELVAGEVIDPTERPTSDPIVSTAPSDGATGGQTDDGQPGEAVTEPETEPAADVAVAPVEPATAIPVAQQVIPPIEEGDAVARIEVPRIGVNDIVVAGVARDDLKRGPGHFPETPLPGQLGNVAIAGHRTTYGQPFHNVDKLAPGDEVTLTTPNGTFVYVVTGQQIVSPSEYQVIATTNADTATLTLVSCHPKWTTRERIIVSAELDPNRSSDVGEPIINYGRPIEPVPAPTELPTEELPTEQQSPSGDELIADEAPTGGGNATVDGDNATDGTTAPGSGESTVTGSQDGAGTDPTGETASGQAPGSENVNAEIADAFAAGWFSDPGANSQVGLWGLLVSAIAALAYLLSRTVRRDWVGLLVGIVPFCVALYFFFQNVNRLLPPAL